MEAIDILMNEHRQIERVLEALEKAVARARRGEGLPIAGFEAAAEFIRRYADERHHEKEEHILFEAMADAGMPKEGGPIAVMLEEHDLGRRLVAEMKQVVSALQSGESTDPERLLDAAEQYAELLAQHIMKEDQVLYPMSMQLLPPDAFEKIERRFREVESGKQPSFEDAADRVIEELGPVVEESVRD